MLTTTHLKGKIMSNTLTVKVSKRNETFEGVVSIPGLRPTKIARQTDNTTTFQNRSALISAAKALASRLRYESVNFEN